MTTPASEQARQCADGWDILSQASERARRGEEFALATVVWRQGPSSGQLGSRAIITATGAVEGWIGGACAEPAVVREAQRVIAERRPTLMLLCTPEQFGAAVPDGVVVVPISCHSEGALQIYIEPVVATPQLAIVGRSPMAHTLANLAQALGWHAEVCDVTEFTGANLHARSVVVVATQGHGDEQAVERAVAAQPAFVGLVASRKRGQAVLGYLADRGVPRHLLDQVQVPVGLDLGHTTHREMAVSILAQLVARRAAGTLVPKDSAPSGRQSEAGEVRDPVCGMTVRVDAASHASTYGGVTYHFCSAGCRQRFEKDPPAYGTESHAAQEARC